MHQVAPNGKFRVLATNLAVETVPAEFFGDLYHRRWRIEEAFKRLKHRLRLEAVSGLSLQASNIDVTAKVLAGNITSLMCAAAAVDADLRACSRKCNRPYAATSVHRLLPGLVQFIGDVAQIIADAIALLRATPQRFVPGRSRPRSPHHVKPHPSCAYKGYG